MTSVGHVVFVPLQVSAGSQLSPDPARQTKVLACTPSAGQTVLLPVQVSATSHAPLAERQTVPPLPTGCWQTLAPLQVSVVHGLPSSVHAVPLVLKVQSAAQQEASVPFVAPSSHCSPVSIEPL